MKKRLAIARLTAFLILVIIVTACSDNEEVTNPPQDNAAEQQQDNNDGTDAGDKNGETQTTSSYPFTDFDLDADFNDMKDTVEIDYEQEAEKTEASYQDKVQEFNLTGNEAMEELDKSFSAFDFDQNTSQEDVLKAVRDAFKLPEDAAIDLEITFSDGTKKEYIVNKP